MKNALDSLDALKHRQTELNRIYKPSFFRLQDNSQKAGFNELLSTPGIMVVDFIEDQVKELIKIKHAERKFSTEELIELTNLHFKGTNREEYGVWVYYEWSNKLVHILDENEFIEVRTSRNQYKITPEERDILSVKKIGVIGLSVGQSVAVTLAMERICTEIRLADFDILELTNLNRIRTGVHNLGLPKVFSVAREISEIDPFLKVVCFPDGLNENNMEAFFTGSGKLDLLVEESDGFDIKILCRYMARDLRIPVIMEGSDRCLVDVERFDLEPDRDILHGLVNHLDVKVLKKLKTNEEKIPYMLDVLGLDDSSMRLKASMLEIEQSITTWPQLASAVTMGGGITADVSRRILLNQYRQSGRYHIDIEDLIGDKKTETKVVKHAYPPALSLAEFAEKTIKYPKGSFNLRKDEIEPIINAACKAPSGGNSQPWRWIYRNSKLFLFNAFDGSLNFLGYDNLASYVGLGAAIENVILSAAERGLKASPELFPDESNKDLVCVLSFTRNDDPPADKDLAAWIDKRLTNRMLGKREKIDNGIMQELSGIAKSFEGVSLKFFDRDDELEKIAELLGELERIRLLDEWGHRDFVSEIRWTREENERTMDGIDIRTLDLTNSEKIGLEIAKDSKILDLIREWKGGGAFRKLTKKSIDAAGAVGIISVKKRAKEDFLKGGMCLQKIWLKANSKGISFQPMSSSVFLYARLLNGNGEGLLPGTKKMLAGLRPEFEKLFLLASDSTELFIFRLAKNAEPEIKSLRRPLDQLFCYYPENAL
jgi:tRNA A37 threonylcarbamoyladenosine dehydratase